MGNVNRLKNDIKAACEGPAERFSDALKSPLSPQESTVLEYQRTKNPILLHKIMAEFRPLVLKTASKYTHHEREDLVQAGFLGLINAVNRFRVIDGGGFISYAAKMIEGEMRHHLRDNLLVRIPRWMHSLSKKIEESVTSFAQSHDRLPTISEIAELANLTEESVEEILKARESLVTLNLPKDSDADQRHVDMEKIHSLHYETFHLPIEDRIALDNALESLNEIQRKVIYYLFYQDLTQTEAAKKLGVTQKKVSRLLNKALVCMRETLYREIW